MPAPLTAREEIMIILRSNPESLSRATVGFTDVLLAACPLPGEWSINEILAHLRGYADTRGDRRILTMIREDSPTIQSVHPNKWAEQARFRELGFHESFAAFAAQRQELLDALQRMPASGWERDATIVGGGGPRVKTVHQTADALARHERLHIKHMTRLAQSISE